MPRSEGQEKRTLAKKRIFLEALTTGLTISEAADVAGAGHRTVNHWRKDPDFLEDWKEAYDKGTALFEAEARRRALTGILDPIYYNGKRVGTKRVFSDRLLELKLRSRAPDRYRDRVSAEHSGPDGSPITGKIEIELVAAKKRSPG